MLHGYCHHFWLTFHISFVNIWEIYADIRLRERSLPPPPSLSLRHGTILCMQQTRFISWSALIRGVNRSSKNWTSENAWTLFGIRSVIQYFLWQFFGLLVIANFRLFPNVCLVTLYEDTCVWLHFGNKWAILGANGIARWAFHPELIGENR